MQRQRQQHYAVRCHVQTQQTLVEHETDRCNGSHGPNAAERKTASLYCDGKADVTAEQIQRAMGQIDDAQQPEDQRKAARHHKQQCGEGQSVEELEDAHP
jgi:hypothetical protein